MKHLLLVSSLVVTAVSSAQQEPKERLTRTPKKVVATAAPVTQREARAVFLKADRIVRQALEVGGAPGSKLTASAKPVTRAEVVAELSRLYDAVLPKAKLSPRPVNFDANRLRIGPAQRANLVKLVRAGAVAPVGPLAAGPRDTLTVPELGDALGFFLARMAEITHMPSRKWTPNLRDE